MPSALKGHHSTITFFVKLFFKEDNFSTTSTDRLLFSLLSVLQNTSLSSPVNRFGQMRLTGEIND